MIIPIRPAFAAISAEHVTVADRLYELLLFWCGRDERGPLGSGALRGVARTVGGRCGDCGGAVVSAAEIRRLASSCVSDAEIAAQTGASRTYIRAVRSRAGIQASMPEKRGPMPRPRPYRVGLTWAWKRAEWLKQRGIGS